MKKLFAVIFSAILISASAIAISGCGCNKDDTANQPATEIVGNWGGRSDEIEAEFKDDGTCVIGGVTGTYDIDENNTLTVTPNTNEETSAEPLTFEHYNNNNTSAIQPNQWAIIDNVLYINGQQYNGATNNADSSNTQGNNSNNQNSSSGIASNQGSSNSDNSSSGSSSENNSDNSDNSNNSNNSGSSSDSSNSSSPSSDKDEEDKVADIVESIDNF